MIKKNIAVCFLISAMALHGAVLAGLPGPYSTERFIPCAEGTNAAAISSMQNMNEPSGPNGAGPDVRDPKYYEKTDKVFLGTWECTSDPHSTLTIKEANPQTGGYYADFFFYRLAHADGYANISGDKLSINQGSVNDDQDFRGIFEKTQAGIRFTVTESGFNYLKPGEKFEYKKMNGKPAVADTDILGKWTLRSWANARIVCYEFTKDNHWIAYSPQWVDPDPRQKSENGSALKKAAAGFYKVQHEGNYDPGFKLFEADGKFYAYVSIENDAEAGCKVLCINGQKTYFYNEKTHS